MSDVNKKKKAKTPQFSSSEANNSFVKNVTARVSGLLSTTIVKWFGSPNSSNANGSAATVDGTDSSTEDEAPETTDNEPPSKRVKHNTYTASYSQSKPSEISSTDTITEESESRNTFRGNSNFLSRPNYMSRPSVVSRPNYVSKSNYVSSHVPSPGEDKKSEESEVDSPAFKPKPSTSDWHTGGLKRKSIFRSSSNTEPPKKPKDNPMSLVKGPSQPCFKPSLLGSPFYPGRTNYGGASVSYINRPNITQVMNRHVNESNSNETSIMSCSTRRIMDLLEQYSSPLVEAKRLQSYMGNSDTSTINNMDSSVSPYSTKSTSYKTRELHVPSMASLLRLKKKSRLMDTTNAARQIIASYSSAAYAPASRTRKTTETSTESNKQTTKIKTHLSRANRGDDLSETLPPVNLPEATLVIDQDKLPKFSFGSTIASSTAWTANVNKSAINVETKSPAEENFKFSSPVRLSTEASSTNLSNLPQFTFGSPERNIDKPELEVKKAKPSTAVKVDNTTDNEKPMSKLKDWQCADCWVNNKADADKCVCCGGKPPAKTTAKDALSTTKLPIQSESQPKDTFKDIKLSAHGNHPTVDKKIWKCDDCWVSNDTSAEKCLCCGAKRPSDSTSAASSVTSKPIESTTAKDWKCDECWITNKATADKCAACGSSKPKEKTGPIQAAMFGMPTTQNFDSDKNKIIRKSQGNNWSCPTCLVENAEDKNKCVCCESGKPGTQKEEKPFHFGKTTMGFKFGIEPDTKTGACKTSTLLTESTFVPIRPKPSYDSNLKDDQSETNNNVPTFSFSLPTKKSTDQTDSLKQKPAEAPKLNFTFGIPKQLPAVVPPQEPAKAAPVLAQPVTENTERPQEVPKVDFGTPGQVESKPFSAGFFNSPQAMQTTPTEKNVNVNLTYTISKANIEQKDVVPSLTLMAPAATTAAAQPPNTFSFSGTGLKMSNLFSPPATTSPETVSFGLPIQAASATSSAAAPAPMSLFQKPEATPKTSAVVFQLNSTSSPSSALFKGGETPRASEVAAPIFSFGNSTSAPAPPPALNSTVQSKPKFNFSFGSANKSDSPSVFKPASTSIFGAPTEIAPPSNKFSFSSGGNGIGAGNTLGSTTQLSGGNGMLAGNTMSTGSLGVVGNGLSTGGSLRPTNEITGNPLGGGNGMQPGNTMSNNTNIFGANVQKENMWNPNANASANVFGTPTNNSTPKPASFTFGSSTPFNTSTPTPSFSNPQPTQNLFGMSTQNNNAHSMFSPPVQNAAAPNIFGHPANNAPEPMSMFGAPTAAAPAFGAPNPPIPSFEAPSLTSAPAFNFGAPQATNVFGFGQQQQQQQQQQLQQQQLQQQLQQQPQQQVSQSGVYSFGGAAAAPQVLFNMGSAPSIPPRRVKKAVRRNPPR